MSSIINTFMQWVSMHPHLTGFFVAVIACTEALAFVGLVVPGAALMLTAGALIGAGLVSFWNIFAWAVGGAILGDGISYWIGYYYRSRLSNINILRRHPQWLSRGTDFFHHHGGKSIILARFIGPVRPIIPVVAGMLGMSPIRFYLNNIFSALAWAGAHLFVGMIVGMSLVIAGQVATRLAFVLVGFIILFWFIIWFVRYSYQKLQPHLTYWLNNITDIKWIKSHPRLNIFITYLFDASSHPRRAIIAWLGLLITSMWLFLGVLEDVISKDPLVYAGQSIFHFLQELRTPLGDTIMIGITELGDTAVTLPLSIAVLIFLLLRRAWRDSFYWISSLGFGLLIVSIIKLMLKFPRPESLYSGIEIYSFPSGHATMSTVVYGLLAVYIAPSIAQHRRWLVYAISALLILFIAFSRLYLGAHWLADVTAGLALGAAGVALISIIRERDTSNINTGIGLLIVTVSVFISAAVWHITNQYNIDHARYTPKHSTIQITESDWHFHVCSSLPIWRIDFGGEKEQPLNVKWAGNLHSIYKTLHSHGWKKPPKFSKRTSLSWLLPHPTLSELPVLPQLHDGVAESLVLIHKMEQQHTHEEQLVLRLWPTSLRVAGNDLPIWNGTIAIQHLVNLHFISFAHLSKDYNQAQDELKNILDTKISYSKQCPVNKKEDDSHWNGDIFVFTNNK